MGLSDSAGVGVLCRQEGGGGILVPLAPYCEDDAHPHVGQGAHGHAMTLAFTPLAPVIGRRPRFLEGGLPGELIQHIAEGLDAGVAAMRLGVVAAGLGQRRRAGQGLHTRRAPIPLPVVAPSCQEPRR